jgi:glycosyltransferase involved in cell wall biosynthesis
MRQMTTGLILVRESFSHMSTVSGFDPLFQHLHEMVDGVESLFVDQTTLTQLHRSRLQRVFRKLSRQNSPITGFDPRSCPSPFSDELHHLIGLLLLEKLSDNPDAKAVLAFGENQYTGCLALAPSHVRSRLIVFMHQPPSWHRLYWRNHQCLEGLGGIACLSEELAGYMRSLSSTHVYTVRHGVALNFFNPSDRPTPSPVIKLLVVGQWLRDFDTLVKAFEIINTSIPSVQLDCVIPRFARTSDHLLRLARFPNVRWHSDLSVEQLRSLYQEATLLFLPLVDATANNTIVEALACGLPIISSAVGGIPAYVVEPFGKLCRAGDPEDHAQAAMSWLNDPARHLLRKQKARAFAEAQLDWTKIAENFKADLQMQ